MKKISFLLVTAVLQLSNQEATVFEEGAPRIAAKLDSISQDTIQILHDDFPNEEYSPQLAYYSSGRTLGWKPSAVPAEATWRAGLLETPDVVGRAVIVEKFRDRFNRAPVAETELLDSLDRKLTREYSQHVFTKAYHLYY